MGNDEYSSHLLVSNCKGVTIGSSRARVVPLTHLPLLPKGILVFIIALIEDLFSRLGYRYYYKKLFRIVSKKKGLMRQGLKLSSLV